MAHCLTVVSPSWLQLIVNLSMNIVVLSYIFANAFLQIIEGA